MTGVTEADEHEELARPPRLHIPDLRMLLGAKSTSVVVDKAISLSSGEFVVGGLYFSPDESAPSCTWGDLPSVKDVAS